DRVGERSTREVWHDDVRLAFRRDAHVHDGHDVGVTRQRAHREGFPREPLTTRRAQAGSEDLDRDGSVEGRLMSAIDDAEPAPSDLDEVLESLEVWRWHAASPSVSSRSGRRPRSLHA